MNWWPWRRRLRVYVHEQRPDQSIIDVESDPVVLAPGDTLVLNDNTHTEKYRIYMIDANTIRVIAQTTGEIKSDPYGLKRQ